MCVLDPAWEAKMKAYGDKNQKLSDLVRVMEIEKD